jgi:hypothetical protein
MKQTTQQLLSGYARRQLALKLQRIHNELYEISSELRMDSTIPSLFAVRVSAAQTLARDAGYELDAYVYDNINGVKTDVFSYSR